MRLGVVLSILAALQLLAGLVVQLLVLRIVGVGPVTDAYVAAQAVPLVLAGLLSGSLQGLWLPRFARLAEDPTALRREQAASQGQVLRLLVGLCLPLWLGLPWWTRWMFPGFSSEQLAQVVALSGPLLAATLVNGQAALLLAAERARDRFIGIEVIALMGSFVMIGLVWLLVPRFGIVAAAWIALARAGMVYILYLRQCGWPPMALQPDASSREVWQQARPLLSVALFIKSSPLVDRFWSSNGSGGDVTLLNIAQLAMNALASIVERSVLVRAVPEFARELQRADLPGLQHSYLRCLARIGLVVLAVGVLLFAARPIWNGVMLRLLQTQPEGATQIWMMCLLLLPALFVAVAGSAAVAVFYAFGETRTPAAIGMFGFMTSIALKGLFFASFGIVGIAAAASTYLIFVMIAHQVAVSRKIARAQTP